MPVLHLFNPGHDEALAAATPFYTATSAARQLAADLAALPAWWGSEGDAVLVPADRAFPAELCGCRLTAAPCWDAVSRIEPWGWDAPLVHTLRRRGAPERLLPSPDALDRIRALSSRHTAVTLLQEVRRDVPHATIGLSEWCSSMADVRDFLRHHPDAILKAPWSSSGRGVFRLTSQSPEPYFRRAERILRQQGGLAAEPRYERLHDLALEYTATPDGVRYEGLSLFRTTSAGLYDGNIVAPDARLLSLLPPELHRPLADVRDSLGRHLTALLAGRYEGPLGVDLMIVRGPAGESLLHPCVEVNLRRTMGHVALALRRRLTPDMPAAVFALRPVSSLSSSSEVLTPCAANVTAAFEPLDAVPICLSEPGE